MGFILCRLNAEIIPITDMKNKANGRENKAAEDMHYEKHYIYILVNGEKCTGKYSLAYILTLKSVIKTSELTLHVKNYILLHFFFF